ncbi:MAG: ATP-binding protein, partial [Gemmatimonadales bacterium]
LLDLSERGRYLGLVLFSAQQFRSQVLRRVVGNAGTSVYGRMDSDELATPGYATLSPATKIKLATLPKGELMVRHPHFTQPVFLRFPRPAMVSGREGIERFPPAAELPFADAVARQLRRLDRGIAATAVLDLIDGRREADVLQALHATRRAGPENPLAWFRARLGERIRGEAVAAAPRSNPAIKRVADPYE